MDEQEKQIIEEQPERTERERKDKKSGGPGLFRRGLEFFNDIRGEARKVIWPDSKELRKKTITVILTSLLFALIIFGYDSIYNVILQLFVGLLGG